MNNMSIVLFSARMFFYVKFIMLLRRLGITPSKGMFRGFYDTVSLIGEQVFSEFNCMNYSFEYLEGNRPELKDKKLEDERYALQLYHYLCSHIPVEGRRVLEAGSGRGGGAAYVLQYMKAGHVTGLELAPSAVKHCKKIFNHIKNLDFIQGDAENMPFEDNTFDIVLNVESSHCYPGFGKFLAETKRVLKPEGYFLLTDFRPRDKMEESMAQPIKNSGFKILKEEDITKNVVAALTKDSGRREKIIENGNFPAFTQKPIRFFAACVGSGRYEDFVERRLIYNTVIMQKQKI